MQNTNEIRQRMNAVGQTRKITNAMHLVATSRMKKVLQSIGYNHRYLSRVDSAMKHILRSSRGVIHPYLTKRGSRKTLIVISGDKGMSGSYNANLLSYAWKEYNKEPVSSFIAVGIMVGKYFRARGIEPDVEFLGFTQDPSLYNARELAFDMLDLYDNNLTDEVEIIYTPYSSGLNRPQTYRMLPLLLSDYEQEGGDIMYGEDIIYVPSVQRLFDRLVPQYIIGITYAALVHAYASEQYSRMNAMQSATRNADDILKNLKTQYNMARQSAITQEIAEITGAADALLNGDK
jgi:F-type H+-transporting ATPase subunit gamma